MLKLIRRLVKLVKLRHCASPRRSRSWSGDVTYHKSGALVLCAVLFYLLFLGCGDNPCNCPFGTVCQPMPSKEGYACIPAPRADDAR